MARNVGLYLVLLMSWIVHTIHLNAQTNITLIEIPGAVSVHITGINNGGDVTGFFCDDDYCSLTHGFLRESNGAIATFEGVPNAINDAGTVVGHFEGEGGFIRSKQGAVTTFNVPYDPNYKFTWAMAINNREEVAGYHVIFGGDVCRLFTRDRRGSLSEILLPQGMIPSGINARGDLTGYNSPYFWERYGYLIERNGDVTMFSVPGFDTSTVGKIAARPTAINNKREVAGYFREAGSGLLRGFLRDSHGTFATFGGIPVAMNERGDVVGYDLLGNLFVRDASSGILVDFPCPGLPTSDNTGYGMHGLQSISMNDRGDVAGGNVICSAH